MNHPSHPASPAPSASAPSGRPHARRRLRRLVLLLLAPTLLGGGLFAASVAEADRRGMPPDTIVFVEGDAANGFGILRHDGSWEFPPTNSEARAECDEHDKHVDRVRCRVAVRTWYRDLADIKRSIEYYRAKLRDR